MWQVLQGDLVWFIQPNASLREDSLKHKLRKVKESVS